MYASFNARALGLATLADRAVALAAAAGFAGVDLPVRDLLDAGTDPHDLRARMDDLGLRGGAWPLPVRWKADEATFHDDLRHLPAQAAAAAALGLFRTGTWVLPETTGRPTPGQAGAELLEATARFHAERLGPIARVLADHGVQLGLEVIGVESFRTGSGVPFVTRLADLGPRLGALLEAHPNIGILLDAFHLHAAGETVEAALVWGIDRVVWVHVADLPRGASADRRQIRDNDRGLPGESGRVDVAGILSALAARGYNGPVTVETRAGYRALCGREEHDVVRAAAESLRLAWPGPDLSSAVTS